MVAAFLNHLENDRHKQPAHPQPAADRHPLAVRLRRAVSPRARRGDPASLGGPAERFDKQLIAFLTAAEIDALVDAPAAGRWEGRRDRALLLLAAQTGLRVSELTGLDCEAVAFANETQHIRRCAPRPQARDPHRDAGTVRTTMRPRLSRGFGARTLELGFANWFRTSPLAFVRIYLANCKSPHTASSSPTAGVVHRRQLRMCAVTLANDDLRIRERC
jgi:integrase